MEIMHRVATRDGDSLTLCSLTEAWTAMARASIRPVGSSITSPRTRSRCCALWRLPDWCLGERSRSKRKTYRHVEVGGQGHQPTYRRTYQPG